MSRHAPPPPDLEELRRQLRRWRNGLAPAVCMRASLAVVARIGELAAFRRARHVAAYVGNRGEIDPMPLLHLAHQMGKACYLPVLHPFLPGRLWFMHWTPDMPMTRNRYGIPEPVCDHRGRRAARWMDLVLVPLLAFDRQCHRVGMGGGFYDRTLAFRRWQQTSRSPTLIGLAHDEQCCDELPSAPWDITLDRIVTPSTQVICTR